jgi:hypothetical protein
VPNVPGIARHAASFRDPAGFVFEHDGDLFRAVHPDAVDDVDSLFSSGLHDELVAAGLLVAHRRVAAPAPLLPADWLLLKPDRLPVISYASEWTDAQILAAARLTLELQRRALRHGLSLKDASSFNVQFLGSRPVFIDLLSFKRIGASRAWPAYRQFCEHFLAPLALRRHLPGAAANVGLNGIALPVASRMLPARTWLTPSLALHIHMHARAAEAGTGKRRVLQADATARAATDFQLQLTVSLAAALEGVHPRSRDSAWAGYRNNNVYSEVSAGRKLQFVKQVVARTRARRALDLGANDGHYARALVDMGLACTAVEIDAACSEQLYASSTVRPYDTLLNTVRVDLTNPTPGHGWAHTERASFVERMRCDLTLALALVHHLSISHQVPFDEIAGFLADLAPCTIVEFVPVTDVMSRQLLEARTGMTEAYLETLSEQSFQAAFAPLFDCKARSEPIEGGRVLYHFERRC